MTHVSTKRSLKIIAFTVTIIMIPVVALAAVGAFTSSTSTPAVTGTNTSSVAGAKAVWGNETGGGGATRYGVYGSVSGPGGVGIQGAGAKYGVFSLGNLGVIRGKSLICNGCVTAADLAASAKPHFAGASDLGHTAIVLESTCTNLKSVTISAPYAGHVLAIGKTVFVPSHTNGTLDAGSFGIGINYLDCGGFEGTGDGSVEQVASALPTGSGDAYATTVPVMRVLDVSAGSHTFYLNARMTAGQDGGDNAAYSQLDVMFIG